MRIRRAAPADVEVLTQLIEELNVHQEEPTGRVTAEAVRRDGFGQPPEFEVLLAEIDGAVVGYLLYHPSWSTEVGGSRIWRRATGWAQRPGSRRPSLAPGVAGRPGA
jgi:hypothetical protein